MSRTVVDITGRRFGMLEVVSFAGIGRRGRGGYHHAATWRVRCDCGTEKVLFGLNLKNGTTVSCGCKKKGRPKKAKPAPAPRVPIHLSCARCSRPFATLNRHHQKYCCPPGCARDAKLERDRTYQRKPRTEEARERDRVRRLMQEPNREQDRARRERDRARRQLLSSALKLAREMGLFEQETSNAT